MSTAASETPAEAAGTITLGGDLTVRRIGFGAMRIRGGTDQVRPLLRRALELGVNLIDTADSYGPERNEKLIRRSLRPYPDDLVIATKGGQIHDENGRAKADGRPEHLRSACEASLRRLRLERIDLYQLHMVDSEVPIEESLGTLGELRAEGKIRHIGVSNVFGERLELARSLVPIVSVQNRYNLNDRASEREIGVCEREGLAFLPWGPLGQGSPATADGACARIAATRNVTPAQVALAWLLHHSPAMVPIPGTSSVEHLEQNVEAAALHLGEEELAELDREPAGRG